MRQWIGLAGILGAWCWSVTPAAAQTQVYTNDFTTDVAGTTMGGVAATWTVDPRRSEFRTLSLNGATHFLGEFENETASLGLSNLPAHQRVRLTFNLYILKSWGGNNDGAGPDYWSLRVKDGCKLLDETFSNGSNGGDPLDYLQSFGGQGKPTKGFDPRQGYSPVEGSTHTDTLGYSHPASPYGDSTYRLAFEIPHTANTIGFEFAGRNLQGAGDETWGLDDVTVELLDSPAVPEPGALALFLPALGVIAVLRRGAREPRQIQEDTP